MSADRGACGEHVAEREAGAFSPEQRVALLAAIAAHDKIDLAAVLPSCVHLDYDARLLERCYWLSYQLWDELDPPASRRLALGLALGRRLAAGDAQAFRDIRARAKQLRFAHATLGADHRYPPLLDRVTRLMGRAQDAGRTGRPMKMLKRGVLCILLTRLRSAAVTRESRGFVAARPDAFRSHILRQIDGIRAALAAPAMTNRTFHETRKVVSRLVAFYDTLTVLAPSDYHRDVDRYLSTINGLMGAMHDKMVERKAANRRDYDLVAEPLPQVVAERLRRLVDAFPAGQHGGAVEPYPPRST